ncbi:hypothetical protein QEN19_004053 [Hanseniaspora menglaensis]
MQEEKSIILEQVSTNGSWTSNISSNEYHKTYVEYTKLCDIFVSARLEGKFIIVPSFKSENMLFCFCFSSLKKDEATTNEFVEKLINYINDPKKYYDHLSELKGIEGGEISETGSKKPYDQEEKEKEEIINEKGESEIDFKRNSVYEETGYETISKSPRKLSITSSYHDPSTITRGSFSNVGSDQTITDLDCNLRLAYLMNEEYFNNSIELEQFFKCNFQIFGRTNEKIDDPDWKNIVINAFKLYNKQIDFI